MRARYRIEGYVIASSDGMLADSTGLMPDSLKIASDQQFFMQALDRVDAVVSGRRSNEGQPDSSRRRRLVATRQIAGIAPDPDNAMALLWNPVGASFEEACRELGLDSGTVAIIGGPEVYSLFFEIGYDAFHLCRANRVSLPGGLPIFPRALFERAPEDVLRRYGLRPEPPRPLDAAEEATLVSWIRATSAS
jgi:dihydrofolate reductase